MRCSEGAAASIQADSAELPAGRGMSPSHKAEIPRVRRPLLKTESSCLRSEVLSTGPSLPLKDGDCRGPFSVAGQPDQSRGFLTTTAVP
jgi:hypothetical protein